MRRSRHPAVRLLREVCELCGISRVLVHWTSVDALGRCSRDGQRWQQLVRPLTTMPEAATCKPLIRSATSRSLHANKRWTREGTSSYSTASKPSRISGQWVSLGLTAITGGGLVWYYITSRQARLEELNTKGTVVGQSALGGPFELVDHTGKKFTNKDLEGEFALLYFGFTYCPDICPDELEKVAEAVNIIEKESKVAIQPVFISIDPERDGVAQVKEYVKEFHPRMIGLTGSPEKVKEAAKAYRVYYTKTNDSPEDYLVDHSIITYLINPQGQFVTFYGKNYTAPEMAESIQQRIRAWKQQYPEYPKPV